MNNALRTLALSAALGACESRDPLAQADEICVRHVDTTHIIVPDTTYPGKYPHPETQEIRDIVTSHIRTVFTKHDVENCQRNDQRKKVLVETTILGVHGWDLQPRVAPQVYKLSKVRIDNDFSVNCGYNYNYRLPIDFRDGWAFANFTAQRLDDTLHCLLD